MDGGPLRSHGRMNYGTLALAVLPATVAVGLILAGWAATRYRRSARTLNRLWRR